MEVLDLFEILCMTASNLCPSLILGMQVFSSIVHIPYRHYSQTLWSTPNKSNHLLVLSNSFRKIKCTLLSYLDCSNEWRLAFEENYNSYCRILGWLISDSCLWWWWWIACVFSFWNKCMFFAFTISFCLMLCDMALRECFFILLHLGECD